MRLLDTLLYYEQIFIHPALLIASLIIGIIILCRKEKVTKFLGIWITCEAVFGILEGIYTLLMRYGGAEKTAHSAIYFRICEIALLCVAALALFLYAKFSYGTRNIVGVLIVVAQVLLAILLPYIYAGIIKPRSFRDPMQFYLILSCINLIPSFIVNILLLSVYFRNRSKEEDLKLLWTNHLIALVFLGIKLVMYLIGAVSVADHHKAMDNFISTGNLLLSVVSMFVLPFFAVYVLAYGRKTPRLPEEK